ncbi:MAG: glycerol-3-phosphate acyltransferase [Puniceicoccales bacterium]|jgi:glycerol-3-phosphate acyltransferase PlsY|nr:glycerol-3-phosphate acyltransferase [Puniceicoccales bacterium]
MDYFLVPFLLLLSYFVGNVSPGWWLTRLFGRGDVRSQGSGGTGATNVARALGKKWFYIVLSLDMFKAALAVLSPFPVAALARAMGATEGIATAVPPLSLHVACAAAVVAGHIWPVCLGFRGGKGVGTFIGAWIAAGAVAWPHYWFLPFTLLGPIVVGLFFLPLKKGAFVAALCGLTAQPLLLWLLTKDTLATILAALTAVGVMFAHRSNLKSAFAKNKPNA